MTDVNYRRTTGLDTERTLNPLDSKSKTFKYQINQSIITIGNYE